MDVRGTNRTAKPAYGARRGPAEAKPESRALAVQDRPAVRRVNRIASHVNPNRRDSTFLAHLALQYDDKSAQNRRITEQRALAISAYATRNSRGRVPRTRPKHGVKV